MNKTVDVLIVGAGGAGCRAAIAAADCGVSVLLLSKRAVGESGATSYPIAEMAGYNAGDVAIPMSVKKHYDDIIAAGQGMADEKLAAIVASEAPNTIKQLELWGVKFEEQNGEYYIFKSCFSDSPRTHVIKGHGEPIIHAMRKQIKQRNNITVMDDITIMGLCVTNEVCVGAYGYRNGEVVYVNAKAVILATGGCGQAFERNMNPADVTGSGYSMAYHAGAKLVNMEFMQIGMGFSWPVVNIFNGYIWEAKPKLFDKEGNDIFRGILPKGISADEVMHEHRKHFPFSSSDISQYLEVAVQNVIRNHKGSTRRGIRVDLSHLTEEYINSLDDDCGIHHMWPIAQDYMKTKGVDLLHDEVEVACYAHAINGGVKIDSGSRSSIEGLYAAGECAGGPHGADRLGGNMMVTCQVFGKIAGVSAAEYALQKDYMVDIECVNNEQINKMRAVLHKEIDDVKMLHALQKSAQDNLLVGRTEEGLKSLKQLTEKMLQDIESAPEGTECNPKNIDLYHMLTTVGIMADSARNRRESRGSHHRFDYPTKNKKYNQPQIVSKIG